jgi:hypothetical protein
VCDAVRLVSATNGRHWYSLCEMYIHGLAQKSIGQPGQGIAQFIIIAILLFSQIDPTCQDTQESEIFIPQISMMPVYFGSRDNLGDHVKMCQHHGRRHQKQK